MLSAALTILAVAHGAAADVQQELRDHGSPAAVVRVVSCRRSGYCRGRISGYVIEFDDTGPAECSWRLRVTGRTWHTTSMVCR